MKRLKYVFVGIFVILGLVACSHSDGIEVTDPWARPGLAEGNSGAFFVIENMGEEDDRLISASSSISKAVELHKTIMENGVMTMEHQEFIRIPAGEKVIFKPAREPKSVTCNCAFCIIISIASVILVALNIHQYGKFGLSKVIVLSVVIMTAMALSCSMISRRIACKNIQAKNKKENEKV